MSVDEGLSTDNRDFNQLQILYKARGQRLEELTSQFQRLQEDSDREIRIQKHKLTLMQGDVTSEDNVPFLVL